MAITHEANEALGTRSNNKTKGLRQLDALLGGRLLSSGDTVPTERKLKTVGGKIVSFDKPLNLAVTGAARAYAGFVKPPNYDELLPAEKRKIQEEFAKRRRENKE